jgi:hypothetical protein
VVRRFLIVANQTLGGDTLVDSVRERLRQGECEFWIVVPATRSSELVVRRSPGGSLMPVTRPGTNPGTESGTKPTSTDRQESGTTSAHRRLDQGLQRLRDAGAEVGGQVGDESPLKAIRACLSERKFDEIILSTLPSGVSRWLHQDLPSRIQRKFDLPVTHIVSSLPEMPRTFLAPRPAAGTTSDRRESREKAAGTDQPPGLDDPTPTTTAAELPASPSPTPSVSGS